MADKQRKIELLAPAGNWERFVTAIQFGADAVYLAGTSFGMRSFAGNFTPEELPDHRYYLFGRGGARRFAEEHGVDFLGEVPIVQSIMEGSEEGRPAAGIDPRVEKWYREIADKIVGKVMKS